MQQSRDINHKMRCPTVGAGFMPALWGTMFLHSAKGFFVTREFIFVFTMQFPPAPSVRLPFRGGAEVVAVLF
jgi:hypothetical protein